MAETVAAHRFEGKSALVTGGSSGIGEASVMRLVAEGAQVTLADLDEKNGEAIAARDDAITFARCDVTDAGSVKETIDGIVERHGKLDAVHANAGIETPPLLLADTPDEWLEKALAVNTTGVFLTCKHSILAMLETGGGSICCMSSIHDVATYPMIGAYSISKAAVGGIVRAISADYATRGIRANAVLPGATLTPMVKREIEDAADPEAQRALIEGIQMMKRCAEPREIAAAVAFLLSDDASFVTGASLAVDGGSLAGLPGPDILQTI